MHTITSRDNQYLKMARAVQSKKGREEHGCYLLEGLRLVSEALDCGVPALFALFAEGALADARMQALVRRLEERQIPAAAVGDQLFANLSATEHPQGVALLANFLAPALQPPEPEHPCFLYADDIRDPGNLGAIIRTAHAAGAGGLILSRESADIYNPKVLRAAMGATFKLPMCRTAHRRQALALMRELKLHIYTAAAQGRDIREAGLDFAAPHIWVLGSEAEGADPFWLTEAKAVVRLPMRPGAESLNVAAAGAALLYYSYFAFHDK